MYDLMNLGPVRTNIGLNAIDRRRWKRRMRTKAFFDNLGWAFVCLVIAPIVISLAIVCLGHKVTNPSYRVKKRDDSMTSEKVSEYFSKGEGVNYQ